MRNYDLVNKKLEILCGCVAVPLSVSVLELKNECVIPNGYTHRDPQFKSLLCQELYNYLYKYKSEEGLLAFLHCSQRVTRATCEPVEMLLAVPTEASCAGFFLVSLSKRMAGKYAKKLLCLLCRSKTCWPL